MNITIEMVISKTTLDSLFLRNKVKLVLCYASEIKSKVRLFKTIDHEYHWPRK